MPDGLSRSTSRFEMDEAGNVVSRWFRISSGPEAIDEVRVYDRALSAAEVGTLGHVRKERSAHDSQRLAASDAVGLSSRWPHGCSTERLPRICRIELRSRNIFSSKQILPAILNCPVGLLGNILYVSCRHR